MTAKKKLERTIRSGSDISDRVTIEAVEGSRPQRFYVEVADVRKNCWIELSRLKLQHLHAAIGALLREPKP